VIDEFPSAASEAGLKFCTIENLFALDKYNMLWSNHTQVADLVVCGGTQTYQLNSNMQCIYCKANDSRVIDSRVTDGGAAIRRRRECVTCRKRFTTYEKPEMAVRLMVVKKDGSRVPYDRSKIVTGLQKACYKRPVSEDQLEHLVDRVEEQVFTTFDREVPSQFIGQKTAEELQRLDDVAYVRFASVYREFRDVGEFIDEAREIMERQAKEHPDQKQLFE
jgi:transcriptional repressor NrdR